MATALAPHQSKTACPQCKQYLEDIARLQAELAEVRAEQRQRHTAQWWGVAALGVSLLLLLVHAPYIFLELIDQLGIGIALSESEWIQYALLGTTIGLPWAQWSLIGIFCMLHEGAAWCRALMYVGLCGIAAVTTLLALTLLDFRDDHFFYLACAGPLLTTVMAMPVLLARVLRRWTMTHRNSKAQARRVSVATYLTGMTVLGVVFAVMKFFPWSEIIADLDDVTVYLLVFGGPLIAVGFLHLWMLPAILNPAGVRSVSWKRWLLFGAILVIGSHSSIGGFAIYLSYTRTFDWGEVALVAALPITLLISAAVFNAVGYLWLRLLDYELRSAKSPV